MGSHTRQYGAGARVRSLLLRPWLLRPAPHSARALDRGERNGADRRRVAALRREGVEAYRFDGARRSRGSIRRSARPRRSSSRSPARWGRRGARTLRPHDRRSAGAAAHRLLLDHRGLWRSRRRLGRRDKRDADAHGARAGRLEDEARWTAAARARGAEADILRLAGIYGPGRNALVNLRRGEARRIVKAGQVSTAPMSMISLRFPALSSRATFRARSGMSPTTSRRRRRT